MRDLVERFLALLVILLISPLLLLVALAIYIDSPGNPLYRARRIGKNGVPFDMWKFRTMVKNASSIGPAVTGNNDPRVLRIGKFLRRSKLDELPQFFNVLFGDMGWIGPRPEAPEFVDLYTPKQRRVLAFKPGMTGKVQLESGDESQKIPAGVNANEFYVRHLMDGKLSTDIAYMETRTVFSDLFLIFSTAGYVFRSIARR
jgi:lipopolysaccharide/colanic/teichoic acid biosynthesis glycosyltransferase